MTFLHHQPGLRRLLLLVLLGALVSAATAQRQTGITPEMVVSLKRVTQVALNPGGDEVAYTLNVPRSLDEPPGRGHSELWVVATSGGNPRPYVAHPGRASSPRWAPDGGSIAYLSKDEDVSPHTQIYTIPLDGGGGRTLTDHDASILAYEWSPDGKWIAFTAGDPESDEQKADKEAGRDWLVSDENYKYRRLWLLEVATGETRQLFKDDLSVRSFTWAPDGKSLTFQAARTPLIDDSYVFKQIYTVAATGGKPRIVTATEGKLGAMSISPDGKQLAFLGAVTLNDPLSQSLFVVPLKGGRASNLSEGYDGSAEGVHWLDDKTLLLGANEGARSALFRVEVGSGGRTRLGQGGPILSSLDVNPAANALAAVAHTPMHPSEVYAGTLTEGFLSRTTIHNPALEGLKLAAQKVITWQGPGGQTIEGVLTFPLNYRKGRRYPLILQVHGGPEGVSLDGWTTRAAYPVQVLAARGYAVLQPNYRGSGGRGVAFSKGDHDDLGGAEFEDILAGIDALVERGLVDAGRVGTGGWSYGGYLSAWAATRHSRRFKAAVVAAGLTNWISFAGTTDIPHEMSLVHWNSYWFDQPELHWERSPMYHLNHAATPTLIVHGMKDERVHPEQSLQLYTGLKLKGVPTALVQYPREPHGLREPAHQLDFINRTLAWFDKYVK